MIDVEIIKALECCKNGQCADCPRIYTPYEIFRCKEDLISNALDLINRQKAEIERLREENNQFADIGKMYSEIKAEAIKEYIEKLKSKAYLENGVTGFQEMVVDVRDIDETYDEMVGDTE
jgi:FtsZ-binding cell division protein ZapB